MHLLRNMVPFLLVVMVCFPWGCRTPQKDMAPGTPVITKNFSQGYDEVWEALKEVITEELMLPLKIQNRERGVMQTDWVSVIRIRGILRWYLRIILDKEDARTVVRIYSRVEEPTTDREAVGKMKTKQGEIKTGWQTSQEEIPETTAVLNRLSSRLGE